MRRILPLILLLAACSKPAPDADAQPKAGMAAADVAAEARKLKLSPGQWETTTLITDIQVPGLAAEAAKAATGTRTVTSNCVTPAQAARPDANFLSGAADANCTYQRFSMAGGRIDAAMTCRPAAGIAAGPGTTTGAVAMTLNGDFSPAAFAMGMDVRTDLPGDAVMTMRARVTGKRTGACAAPTAGAETTTTGETKS